MFPYRFLTLYFFDVCYEGVRGLLMQLARLHSDHTKDDKFNIVNFGDEERVGAWKAAAEKPEDVTSFFLIFLCSFF